MRCRGAEGCKAGLRTVLPKRRRFASALVLMWVTGMLPVHVVGADGHVEPSAPQIKAALLYKFLGYVEWPSRAFATSRAPLVIAVVGDDDVAQALRALLPQHATYGERLVILRTADPDDSFDGVHLLYVGVSENARIGTYARLAQQHAMLLVTDAKNALNDGSMINFLRVGDRFRFEISLEAANRARLRISARLLEVAYRVEKGTL
jgi:hypothetical protein